MKRILLSLLFVLFAFCAKAMSYEDARDQAWFLTDKMAYELNLTPEQYDRAYQINLDYLMSLRTPSDCSGYHWSYRDADLRCILFDWQYNLYSTLTYFYRPVRWYQASWYYSVFDRYRYGYYYFDCPHVYVTYRGGMWRRRSHNDPSPYVAMRPTRGSGMRDHYQNREWFGGNMNSRPNHNNSRPGFNTGRPNNNGRPNNGRPDYNNGRPNNNARPEFNYGRPENNDRPSRPNNGNSFRDEYTNYRQTGNSSNSSNSGRRFGSGVGAPNNNRGNNRVNNSGNSGRSQRGTITTPQGNRGGGRGLGR